MEPVFLYWLPDDLMSTLPAASGMVRRWVATAVDMPPLDCGFHHVPCTTNPLGVKGAGEAGAVGAPAAVVNAVVNALGVRHLDMPLTSEKIWRSA